MGESTQIVCTVAIRVLIPAGAAARMSDAVRSWR
jgi:hypothetical protein